MKRLTGKAAVFLALSAAGIAAALYSLKIRNYILLAITILFAAVSADNIFCNLKDNSIKKG